MSENKADPLREALIKIRQIANGGGHPRLIIAKIYDIATRASRLDASVVVADMKQCPSVNAYVADYEYRGDQDYKPNEHEQAMIEDAIEGYIADRALAAPQPAAPNPNNMPDAWEYQAETNCVVCSGCMFRYGAEHPDGDGKWTCPNCGDGNGNLLATPSDFERAFTDACDEIGCAYDNEALLQAIADLKKPAAPLGGRDEIARMIRKALVENWRDAYDGRQWDEDVLLTGCRKVGGGMGYQKPEEAAQRLALDAADAILAAIPQERGTDRAAIIAECAKVADEAKLAAHIHHGVDASIGADIAARRIRALADKETGQQSHKGIF